MKDIERLARRLATSLSGGGDVAWESYRAAVRDLLSEAREPSEAMQRAGFFANVHRLPDGGRVMMPADKAWQAIIDEILK